MTTVVLLPGLICDDAVWSAQTKALKAEGYETLVIDYGNLSSLSSMASHALRNAPEHFILFGHSMGGRIALEVARQAPERVTGLVLMDTGHLALASGAAGQQEVAGRLALVNVAKTDGMREMGKRWMKNMVLPKHLEDEVLCNAILDMIERKTPEQFEGQQTALINRPAASDVLKSLSCATCFITGDQDAWSPLERHYDMAALVPRKSPVYSIQDSGHMSTMEQPERVNEAIMAWIKTV